MEINILKKLKKEVLRANLELPLRNLVTLSWGNVSGIDRNSGLIVIKPSGVPYERIKLNHLVVVNLDGEVVEGKLKPSSDTPSHIEIYKKFKLVGGVTHTHSKWATIWAQAGKSIPVLGTTHADYFYGDIPCTEKMGNADIIKNYEKSTGKLITKTFCDLDSSKMPGILVKNHGPFCWGKDAMDSVYNAVVLEEIAMTAYYTCLINPDIKNIDHELLDKHFLRKHGANAYYGQKKL